MIINSIHIEQISERLAEVKQRIAQACDRANRDPAEVTLIAVSKTYPAEMVAVGQAAGLQDFGENRAQELVQKAPFVPGQIEGGEIRWHFIGPLQRNKAKFVLRHADMFHALDNLRLAEALHERALRVGRQLPCLIQVNTSGETTKFGLPPSGLIRFIKALAPFTHLRIQGLMTIATPVVDPEAVRPEFRLMRELFTAASELDLPHINMQHLSMGMSHDFEVAIEEGATQIRLGTALFGQRG